MRIRPVATAELSYVDWQTDRHDEVRGLEL